MNNVKCIMILDKQLVPKNLKKFKKLPNTQVLIISYSECAYT